MAEVSGPGPVQLWLAAYDWVRGHENPNASDTHGIKHRILGGQVLGTPLSRRESNAVWRAWQGRTLNAAQQARLVNVYTRAGQPLPGTGPSPADQGPASYPYTSTIADFGIAARYSGPLKRYNNRKKKKKKSWWATVFGSAIFQDLLDQPRAMPRPPDEFDRLLKKVPSEFERILARRPTYVPRSLPTVIQTAGRSVVRVLSGPAAVLAGVLYPSTITERNVTRDEILRRFPRPQAPRVPPIAPAPPRIVVPGVLPRRPLPLPTQTGPAPAPGQVPRPVVVPLPRQIPQPIAGPAPSPAGRPTPASTTRPSPTALGSSWPFLLPLVSGFLAPGTLPKKRPRVVVSPQPLTGIQPRAVPSDSGDNCNCQSQKRTKRERKKRCTNPVIKRTRRGDILTITRKIKCPA